MLNNKPKIEPLPIDTVEEINAQNRISAMLKKSGYKSPMLARFAGKREDWKPYG